MSLFGVARHARGTPPAPRERLDEGKVLRAVCELLDQLELKSDRAVNLRRIEAHRDEDLSYGLSFVPTLKVQRFEGKCICGVLLVCARVGDDAIKPRKVLINIDERLSLFETGRPADFSTTSEFMREHEAYLETTRFVADAATLDRMSNATEMFVTIEGRSGRESVKLNPPELDVLKRIVAVFRLLEGATARGIDVYDLLSESDVNATRKAIKNERERVEKEARERHERLAEIEAERVRREVASRIEIEVTAIKDKKFTHKLRIENKSDRDIMSVRIVVKSGATELRLSLPVLSKGKSKSKRIRLTAGASPSASVVDFVVETKQK